MPSVRASRRARRRRAGGSCPSRHPPPSRTSGIDSEVLLPHGVQDAPLNGLEAVADVGKRARGDDRERVVEIATLRGLVEGDCVAHAAWRRRGWSTRFRQIEQRRRRRARSSGQEKLRWDGTCQSGSLDCILVRWTRRLRERHCGFCVRSSATTIGIGFAHGRRSTSATCVAQWLN